jgi:hypothetical protein
MVIFPIIASPVAQITGVNHLFTNANEQQDHQDGLKEGTQREM